MSATKGEKMLIHKHADIVNKRYTNSQSNFVTLESRLDQSLKLAQYFKAQLEQVIDEFKRRHKSNWKSFNDMTICKAIMVDADKILIDTTMQRPVNLKHIIKIINYFKETMVMAIQVYEDPQKPGYYIGWDGQHTAIVLYILITKLFGERLADFKFPVVIYPMKHKLEIRRNFILLNGDAKEPLEHIDKFIHQVYGVKVDGSDDPEWLDTAKKNDYLAQSGLFATNSKFGDEDEEGAFTLLADTLMSKSLKTRKHPEVTRMFTKYWVFLNPERPVEAKEARMLYEYFNSCYEQKINVDDQYLLDLVAFNKKYFEANFTETGSFWSKVKQAYEIWYQKANPETYAESGLKGFVTEPRCGIPFYIAQLKKSTELKTPKYDVNNGFTVNKDLLW
jgi:hypothetical protein